MPEEEGLEEGGGRASASPAVTGPSVKIESGRNGRVSATLTFQRAAEELHRQAGLYEMQIEGVKRCTPKGKRSGIRLSHLAHAVTRTIRGRDRYLAEAEAALRSPCAAL